MQGEAKILVAGATGTNGRELLKKLSAEKVYAKAMVRSKEKAVDVQSEFVELVEADLNDMASIKSAMEDIAKAYIVTAVSEKAVDYYETFFEAAKQTGVEHIVKFSGYGADSNANSEILRQHAESDNLLIQSGLTYTIIRPNSFYQNILLQSRQIKARGKFSLPMAQAKQSLIDVRDIAEATFKILTEEGHENKVYDFTGPEALSFSDVAMIFSDELGKPVKYIPGTREATEQGLKAFGLPEWDARALAEIQDDFSSGAYADVSEDIESILGRKPLGFDVFVRDHINQFSK